MANYGYQPNPNSQSYAAQNNLNFYQSSYSNQPVSGHSTPFQAAYGSGAQSNAYPQGSYGSSANYGFGAFPGQPGPSGQMGTGQGGLRTGWLAAFGTEGYEGEPPLLEELGVNFGHIQMKVGTMACEDRIEHRKC
jgi:protein YIPF5/7